MTLCFGRAPANEYLKRKVNFLEFQVAIKDSLQDFYSFNHQNRSNKLRTYQNIKS